MSLSAKFKDNFMKRTGHATGKLMGAGVGHSLNAVRAFGNVMTQPVVSVGRYFMPAVAEVAKIERTKGATINKQPFQVDAHTLSQMTTVEAVKSGFIQGFNNAVHNKTKPKAAKAQKLEQQRPNPSLKGYAPA